MGRVFKVRICKNPKTIDNETLDFGDFTLATSMGALCYLITITLGSGSYSDYMGDTLAKIVTLLLFQVLSFVSVGFLIYLAEYVSQKLKLKKQKPIKLNGLKKARQWVFSISALALVTALAVKFGFDWYYDNENTTRDVVAIALAVFSGLLAVISIMLHMAYEIMNSGWRTWVFMALFGFVAAIIWINAYRDVNKSALVADSQYCYWLSASSLLPSLNNIPNSQDNDQEITPRHQIERACIRLKNKNIEYTRYITVPPE